MTNAELLEELSENERLSRPAVLKAHREEIYQVTGLRVPRNPRRIRSWYDNKKGVITRRINEELEDNEETEDNEEAEENPEDEE